jgi:hypothetical membrane protein
MKASFPLASRLASRVSRYAAVVAALLFTGTALVMAARIEGYSHVLHPLALLGAKPLPGADLFNLLAFVLPGALVAWVAWRVRAMLPAAARWPARIGAQLLWLSALAFALQGVLPLDAGDLDGVRSARHAAAWMVWWIAFAAGGLLLARGLRGADGWQAIASTSLLAAVLVPLCALVLPQLVPAGIAQRLAFALWFAWAIHAGLAVSRAPQP